MASKVNHISILQFDPHFISALRVRRSARGVEIAAHECERGDWAVEDGSLQNALADFARRHKLASDQVYAILPRHSMTARILRLPSHDASEVLKMVRLGAEEYVPYPAEELVIDACILDTLSDGHARVFTVFAHRDEVEQSMALMRGAGVEPRDLLVSTACLASAVIAARKGSDERAAVADLAPGGLEVVAFDGPRLEFSRGVAALQDWARVEDAYHMVTDEFVSELKSSLGAYRRESAEGADVERIYVSSSYVDADPFAEAAAESLGEDCAPARFVNAVAGRGAERVSGYPLVAIGGALAAQDRAAVDVRLVPESMARARKRAQAQKQAGRLGAAAALAAILLGLFFWQEASRRQAYIEKLQREITRYAPAAEGVAEKEAQLATVRKAVDRGGSALEVLANVARLFPQDGVNISRFIYKHGEEAIIKGRWHDTSGSFSIAEQLRDAGLKGDYPLFRRARTGKVEDAVEQSRQITEFTIEIPFTDEQEQSGGQFYAEDSIEFN